MPGVLPATHGFIVPTDRDFRVLGIQKTRAKTEYLGHALSFCLGIFGDLGFENSEVLLHCIYFFLKGF